MVRSALKSVGFTPSINNKAGLSKGQKAFNALIKQIEKRRATLQEWEVITPKIQQKLVDELLPLMKAADEAQMRFVHVLDRAHGVKGLTKTERRMLSEIIAELAGGLAGKLDNAEMKAVYDRHSETDLDSGVAAELDRMKQAMEDAFGFDLGADDASMEEVIERAHSQLNEKLKADDEAREQARKQHQAKRKKTAKQEAAEEKTRAEQAQLSLSIREVYRKLASLLHPDREADPAERGRKTALMQRVNQAYEKNDLLRLLELQLELEHIDQAAIDNISESRLSHYNKILKEQVGELDQELMHVEGRFRDQFGLHPFAAISPKTVSRSLGQNIKGLREYVRHIEIDMRACEDVRQLKMRLKQWHREISMPDFDDLPEGMLF